MNVPSSLLSSFVTLFVTIGPIETAVIFAGLTSGIHHREGRSLALRSVAIAGLMLLLFAVGGDLALSLLHAASISRRRRNAAFPPGVDADIFESRSFLDQ